MKGCSRQTCISVLLVAAISVFVLGLVSLFIWPKVFDLVVSKYMSLDRDNPGYPYWKKTTLPIYIKFYIFNVTNPDEIINKHTKPVLQEVGPYTYREFREKTHIKFFKNSTVTYQQKRTWIFERNMSIGDDSDLVVTLNPVLVSTGYQLRHSPTYKRILVSVLMNFLKEKLFIKTNIKKLMFDGIDDSLLNFVQKHFPGSINVPYDKFGWFYGRNSTDYFDGVFTMHTGQDDIELLGKVDRWNLTHTVPYYTSYCGMVNGSAGELWPPHRSKTNISFYLPDLCRTIFLSYRQNVVHQDIDSYRYVTPDVMLANKTECPDNWCYCSGGRCNPQGILNVSTCRYGAPAFISYPHFLGADPVYREAVTGMHPDEEQHRFYMDLEPMTGIVTEVSARLQVNMLLTPIPFISLLENVPHMFFPCFWFSETAYIADDLAAQLSKLIHTMPKAMKGTGIAMLVACVCICIVLLVLFLRRETSTPQNVSREEENDLLNSEDQRRSSDSSVSESTVQE